jgi:hypothetical protein
MSASIPQAPGQTPQAPLVGSGTDYSSLVQGSTDPTDTTLVIRQVIPGMLTFSLPFVCPLLLFLPSSFPDQGEKWILILEPIRCHAHRRSNHRYPTHPIY